MKAGIIPRLSKTIIPIYLESTPDSTEQKLRQSLAKRIEKDGRRSSIADLSLVELLGEIRRGGGFEKQQKVVLILDQFEQWLYAHPMMAGTVLLDALKQADGVRLQVNVMVRDDFWMAATRFFRELDIPLVERVNSGAVDLFDLQHAERVLKAFGYAFGRLELQKNEERSEQKRFITQAINETIGERQGYFGSPISFCEMMKSRTWKLETLKNVGGTSGLGATFLEESFSASSAPPSYRFHEKAAQQVLRRLLPSRVAEIKGHSVSRAELLEVSGYTTRPQDFELLCTSWIENCD